jgi:hypothetical protein
MLLATFFQIISAPDASEEVFLYILQKCNIISNSS